MNSETQWVYIVDDDLSLCRALARLLRATGKLVATFLSATEFLEYERSDAPSCLILDVHMPELNGLELQEELVNRQMLLPIIFMTAEGDIPMSVRAMKAGAVDFLPKPCEEKQLLSLVDEALTRDRQDRERRSRISEIQSRLTELSPREREVLLHVTAGLPNKLIAFQMGIKEKTVKVHRGQVMQKMQASSLAELVRMADSGRP
ncbi:response regulator transcription factor [Lacunimicrobium album]